MTPGDHFCIHRFIDAIKYIYTIKIPCVTCYGTSGTCCGTYDTWSNWTVNRRGSKQDGKLFFLKSPKRRQDRPSDSNIQILDYSDV